jgi:hypothetical protein
MMIDNIYHHVELDQIAVELAREYIRLMEDAAASEPAKPGDQA